jgi:hypothetical protein
MAASIYVVDARLQLPQDLLPTLTKPAKST